MTPEQIKLIKLTFSQVMSDKEGVGRMFYDRLFAIAPETKAMFHGDISAQSRKLMDTLALAIGMLRDTPSLVKVLQELAVRHVRYGVTEKHYGLVGEALIWTLERRLGAAFTHEARAAWTALYGAVCEIMLDAAKGAAASRVA